MPRIKPENSGQAGIRHGKTLCWLKAQIMQKGYFSYHLHDQVHKA
jgi:hypothetical protein